MNKNQEHIIRINNVKNHIDNNLKDDLHLSELADLAFLSPFHFQRVFKAIEGESPKQYIKRRRLETVAHSIALEKEKSILEIAIQYGFNSLPALSRAFKNQYGLSPKQFEQHNQEERIKILHTNIQNEKPQKINLDDFLPTDTDKLNVEIQKNPPLKIVYHPVKLTDIETLKKGYKKTKDWAISNDAFSSSSEVFGLLNDYPAFTPLEKCRFYTCVSVDNEPELNDTFQFMEIPSRTYAVFQIYGGIDALIQSVTNFANNWLPNSSYKINHVPAIIKPLQNPITNHPHHISYKIFIAISPK